MKMETVQAELQRWGEIFITTQGGTTYEIHLGDTEFDFQRRLIRLKTPAEEYVIDGDAVEAIRMHYGHQLGGSHER